jgi:glycosyltransferase involved in cell wall biosynthesis
MTSPIRFLFILYFTPPAPGTAPKRNYRILKYLSGKAGKNFLLTVKYPGRPVPEIPGVTTSASTALDYRTLLRRKTRDGYLPEQKKAGAWRQWGIKLINTFPFSILIGEGGFFYFLSLLRRGSRLIREENITHLYSSFRPFADHYAAYWLKRKHPHLIWIADFRDVIVDQHYRHLFFPKNHQVLFKKIFSKADLLTTVSEGLAKHLKLYHSKVHVVRNGIDTDARPVPPASCEHFTISYTGSMFLDTRNPRPLFKALHSLFKKDKIAINDIRLVYAGKDSSVWQELTDQYDLSQILDDQGLVDDQTARQLQQQSCINLLLTISSPELTGILTGKLIEYFQAGSPVLGIVSGQNDDELNTMFTELAIGQSFSDRPEDLHSIEDFLFGEYNYWKQNGTNRKPVKWEVLKERYSMDSIMQEFSRDIFSSNSVRHGVSL